jgi:hypothetical protein
VSSFSVILQTAFTPDALGYWRDYLWEYLEGGIAQCIPSLILPAAATRWALVLEHKDADVLWLAKGAPRRWSAASLSPNASVALSAINVPTRFGTVTFSSQNLVAVDAEKRETGNFTVTDLETAIMTVSFAPPPFAPSSGLPSKLVLVLRMRASMPGRVMSVVNLTVSSGPVDCTELEAYAPSTESVNVSITCLQTYRGSIGFVIAAGFSG